MAEEQKSKVEEKQVIKVEKKDGVAWLTFDNPPVNVFNGKNMLQVCDALMEAKADPEVKVVVFTNAGERAFSAGMSVPEHGGGSGGGLGGGEQAMSTAVTNLDKPLIAAINGYCLGGAIKFILDCDMVIASEKSTFAHPEIKVGQQAGFYGLPFFFGKHRAMEFVLSGDRISARQAESWGLVNKVVPNETFRQEVENFVKRFTANSGILLSLVRQGLATVASKSPEEAKLELAKISSKIRESEDHREGMKAFAEKRPPQWKNR